ncbi:MAG: NAD(P)/FAD-dependent oxidoreductase [Pseudomonadota bacterium]
MSTDQKVALVGAGVAGLYTALALSRRGFEVDIYERDVPPPAGDADQAFFNWQRRGAAQFRHPHAFLGLMCSTLEANYPDLLDEIFATGARRVDFKDMVPPGLLQEYRPEPGDEELWVLMCRRATMETVLRSYVARQPGININNTTYVTGVDTARDGPTGPLRVTGLGLTDRANHNQRSTLNPDLVVDATGRASKFRQWLQLQGATIPERNEDAEIVYYTRHYRLHPGIEEPNRHDHEPFAGDLGYMKYGVFPGEDGHFAVIICVPNHETELRAAIKTPAHFDAICMQIPGLRPWLDSSQSSATTPSFGIGDIHAVWRDFVRDEQPELLNYFAVGDAAVRTNPLYGRGCSTGILHAHLLAEVLAEHSEPEARALAFHAITQERMRPIWDASLNEDQNGIKRANAVLNGQPLNQADTLKKWFGLAFGDALAACVREEIHVFRGTMRTVNLVEKPGHFLKDPKIRRTVFRYMLRGRKRNAKARVQRGPERLEMLKFVADLEPPIASAG